MAVEMKAARKQKEAVEAIQKVGGFVVYDCQVDASGNRIPNAKPSGPEWQRKLLTDDFFGAVVRLDIFSDQITDAGLAPIARLTQLHKLYLSGTQITDGGVARLAGLTRLQKLYLSDTRITDGACGLRG